MPLNGNDHILLLFSFSGCHCCILMHFSLLFLQEIICQKNTVSTKIFFHTFAHNRTYYTVQRKCLFKNCAASSASCTLCFSSQRYKRAFSCAAVEKLWEIFGPMQHVNGFCCRSVVCWMFVWTCHLHVDLKKNKQKKTVFMQKRAAFKSVGAFKRRKSSSVWLRLNKTTEADLKSAFQSCR